MSREYKIAVIGCGIGGLAAANLLARDGHHVQIFERFVKPQPVGSGLVIQPVGQEVLRKLGLLDIAMAHGAPITRMLGSETGSGRIVLDVSYTRSGKNRVGLALHRASLFDCLYQAAKSRGIEILTNHDVSGVTDVAPRSLILRSGTRIGPFDLIIDASGATSELRHATGRPLPYGAIWGNVDWPEGVDMRSDMLHQRYKGARNMLGVLPIGKMPGETTRKAALFWSLPTKDYEKWRAAPLEQWHAQAAEIWPEFANFSNQITNHDQMTMAYYTHGTLIPAWQDGLVHIGDAAHTASPQLGQGANMALLDAAALCGALRLDRPMPKQLAKYAAARRWHVQLYQTFSSIFTPFYQSDSDILPFIRNNLLMPVSYIPPMPYFLSKLVCGDLINPRTPDV